MYSPNRLKVTFGRRFGIYLKARQWLKDYLPIVYRDAASFTETEISQLVEVEIADPNNISFTFINHIVTFTNPFVYSHSRNM